MSLYCKHVHVKDRWHGCYILLHLLQVGCVGALADLACIRDDSTLRCGRCFVCLAFGQCIDSVDDLQGHQECETAIVGCTDGLC